MRRKPPLSGGNEASLLCQGEALFPAMVKAIEQARHDIGLVTYLYNNQGSVLPITQALIAAVQRGVRVRLIIDGFGARTDLPALYAQLHQAGVSVCVFRPIKRWWNWLQPSQLRRLHQKICVIDEATAFVGGINLIDDRFDHNHGWSDAPRLDFSVQLQGPVVASIAQALHDLWTRIHLGTEISQELSAMAKGMKPVGETTKELMKKLYLQPQHKTAQPLQGQSNSMGGVRAAFVVRDNFRHRRAIERCYIVAMGQAQTRIDLISPYFYPGRVFRRALQQAAQRGVRVRLLLQGKVDYRIAAWAAQALYDELLRSGVEIFEYTPAFLHAKVAVIDQTWSTVGSSNIDPLSLLLNLEANAVIEDATFAANLAAQLDIAITQSRAIDFSTTQYPSGLRGALRRRWVAGCAHVYMRLAGAAGRY
jgi:cardiolipin synthase A/B